MRLISVMVVSILLVGPLYSKEKRIVISDRVVEELNRVGFFFAGLLFLKHHNQDYLHLQFKNSNEIGTKNFVCYSNFSKNLVGFIKKDKKRNR